MIKQVINNNKIVLNFKRCIIIIVMIHVVQIVSSQSNRIDSLYGLLKNENDDTKKAKIESDICSECLTKNNLKEALQCAQDNLKFVESLNFKQGIANATLTIGRIYSRMDRYEEAIKNIELASTAYNEIHQTAGFAAANYSLAVAHYHQGDYQVALKNLELALQNYKNLDLKKDIGSCYNLSGEIQYSLGNFKESLSDFEKAVKLFDETKDKIGSADAYCNIASIYQNQGQSINALENYYAAMKIYESFGDGRSIAGTYINIGNVYDSQENAEDAMSAYRKALKKSMEINSKFMIAAALTSIGITLFEQKKFKEANDTLKIALQINKEVGNKESMCEDYRNLGRVNLSIGEHKEAEKYFRSEIQLSSESENKQNLATGLIDMGKLFIKLNQPDSSRKYLLDGIHIDQEIGDYENLQTGYNGLYELNVLTGDYKNALEYFKKYTECKDSILNEKKSKQLAEMKEKFETEQKDHQIQLQNVDLQKQKQRNNFLIGFLLLFAVISFLIYREYANRHKIKLQELRNKIASDLHDDVGSTLSSISIFSQIAQERPSEVQSLLQTIEDSSRKMLDAMADIVWTIKPENDDFEKIILRMRSFAYELLGAKQIEFRFVVDKNASNINIPMDARKNLYLIFKEATNNLVKYSNATKAEFKITTEQANLVINIRDNGSGFESTKEFMGNGLKNMKARAKEIGALLSIDSEIGIGTNICLSLAV